MNTTENQNDIYAHLRLEYLRSLCGGYEPHCAGWTRQMLPDGYRPLAKGEVIQNGVDEIYYEFATPKWHKCSSPEGTSAMPTMQHRRTKRPIEYHIAPDPAPTYHTPNVVQQRREEAAAINTAMNPAPAGKLSDKELGVIGAKEASNWLKERAHTFSMVVNDSSAWWGQDAPARTAFARAVREAVEKEQAEEITRLTAIIEQAIEMVNTPGTTKDNLPKAINAKIMQRDEFHDATLKKLDAANTELKRLQSASRMCTADMDALKDQLAKANAELEQRRKVMADIVRELGHGLAGLAHHEIQPAIASLRERNHELNERLAVADFEIQQANAELERLRWRSVEVKPTQEDADPQGQVEIFLKAGTSSRFNIVNFPWNGWQVIWWRPFCPPPAPTAKEVSRAEFEAWAKHRGMDLRIGNEPDRYSSTQTDWAWGSWQAARAAKEVKA